jgi:lipopolysaccharide/colanic/teichoic acid biosynthesis glycosyltransferase
MSDLRYLTVVRRDLVAKPLVNPQTADRNLPFARLAVAPEVQGYVRLKTSIEWCVALVLLVFMSPLLLGLAILVRLTSKGSVIYSQWRVGRSGKPFRIYKLRTMVHQCEAHTGPVWAVADDPRSTRVGRWLRDTHLDELPQLWNVLRGQMSLIGPRPERPEIAAQIEQTIPEFQYRLLVRPGITGLAQMRLPADSNLDTVRRKLAHDLYYIRHLGLWLDARIVVSTPLRFLGDAALSMSRRITQPASVSVPLTEREHQSQAGESPEPAGSQTVTAEHWEEELRAAA